MVSALPNRAFWSFLNYVYIRFPVGGLPFWKLFFKFLYFFLAPLKGSSFLTVPRMNVFSGGRFLRLVLFPLPVFPRIRIFSAMIITPLSLIFRGSQLDFKAFYFSNLVFIPWNCLFPSRLSAIGRHLLRHLLQAFSR